MDNKVPSTPRGGPGTILLRSVISGQRARGSGSAGLCLIATIKVMQTAVYLRYPACVDKLVSSVSILSCLCLRTEYFTNGCYVPLLSFLLGDRSMLLMLSILSALEITHRPVRHQFVDTFSESAWQMLPAQPAWVEPAPYGHTVPAQITRARHTALYS